MKRILVVNVNWLGDVVFSSPVFKNLRSAFPNAHIACMAPPRVKEALERIEGVDEIFEFDEAGAQKSLWGKFKFISRLRKGNFDIAFFLHRSMTRALLVKWAGVPERVGYFTKKRHKLLTKAIDPLPLEKVHRADIYLGVLEGYGIEIKDRVSALYLSEDELNVAGELLKDNGVTGEFIVLNSGGNWDLKRWPASRFSMLADQLFMVTGKQIVLSGARKDIELCKGILLRCRVAKPIVLAGQTNLVEAFAVLALADVVVSNDSGPLHVANSVGTNVVAIFGPTRPELTGPRGSGKQEVLHVDVGCNRKPCYFGECKDNVCMKAITVKGVVDAVKKF